MKCLDTEYWEVDLHAMLVEMKEEVQAHMAITEELTNKARGNSKSYLTAINGNSFIFSTIQGAVILSCSYMSKMRLSNRAWQYY